MDFPQLEPEPWPGYSLILGVRLFNFCMESYNILARSVAVKADLIAKSGLPTYPKKIVSPENNATSCRFLSFNRKQELSRVCPGVWITFITTDPNLISEPSSCYFILNLLSARIELGPIIIGAPVNSKCPDRKSA
jgi:hypothetical protein